MKIGIGNEFETTAEEKILKAAQIVFMEKGFDGTRMQEIADLAGINKALLHYYFRSKDKLFMAVFESAIGKLIPSLVNVFSREGSLCEKIRDFYIVHMTFLLENPMVPRFIVNEMSLQPEKLKPFFDQLKEVNIYAKFNNLIQESIKSGEIRFIDPIQLLINLISLSVFPIIGGPMIKGILDISDQEYKLILESRKAAAAEFVIQAISVHPS